MELVAVPGARVFEYGSGGSTLWFADRGCVVVSVEHDTYWHRRVMVALSPEERTRVCCLCCPPVAAADPIRQARWMSGSQAHTGLSFERYVRAIDKYEDHSFDLILVDGRARNAALRRAWPKVREGGVLVLDNSDRARYRGAMEELPLSTRKDYHGPAAYSRWFWCTTIWQRSTK